MYHNPVLLHESIEGLRISPGGIYVDATFGGGGHSRAILEKLEGGRLIGIDQDADASANAVDDPRFTLVHGNFRYLIQYLRYLGALPADGILADLGISSHQIDRPERGFTLRADAPLDMRMDRGLEQNAATLLASATQEALQKILKDFGEIQHAGRVASSLIRYRETQPLDTSDTIREALRPMIPARQEHKFLAKVFQALRIAVNDELEALKEFLMQCPDVLKPGGRLVVIAYHSLEDRLVKHFLRSGNFEDKPDTDFFGNVSAPFRAITRSALTPSEEEMAENNRARSARLRIGERQ
ncbi:MAG: 16S rRNA (cytosine(1402)-N(4))-methyltransferase RsmH [Bacteroidales bacterium]